VTVVCLVHVGNVHGCGVREQPRVKGNSTCPHHMFASAYATGMHAFRAVTGMRDALRVPISVPYSGRKRRGRRGSCHCRWARSGPSGSGSSDGTQNGGRRSFNSRIRVAPLRVGRIAGTMRAGVVWCMCCVRGGWRFRPSYRRMRYADQTVAQGVALSAVTQRTWNANCEYAFSIAG
jgi:hypothetical protein